jgi:alpha-tubulin suppressor-like RCC1 family protein
MATCLRALTNQSSLPVQVKGLASAVQVSTGGSHTCALTSDGSVWCWGDNSAGQLGTGAAGERAHSLTPVRVTSAGTSAVEIHAAWEATCIRNQDGAIWCWGSRDYGQMGDGDVGLGLSPSPAAGCR